MALDDSLGHNKARNNKIKDRKRTIAKKVAKIKSSFSKLKKGIVNLFRKRKPRVHLLDSINHKKSFLFTCITL